MFTCENQWNAASRAAGEIFGRKLEKTGKPDTIPNPTIKKQGQIYLYIHSLILPQGISSRKNYFVYLRKNHVHFLRKISHFRRKF